MIQVNNRGPVSMTSRFKPAALRGLGALSYEKEGTSYVANDITTLGLFKQLQRLVNNIFDHDLARPLGMPLIPGKLSVDGKLGPKTFSAVSQYLTVKKINVMGVSSGPPASLEALVADVPGYVAMLSVASGVSAPTVSASVMPGDYQGSSYAPGVTEPKPPGVTKPKPPTPPTPGTEKSSAVVYIAGGLLALGAILLLSKTGSKVPKRKGFRGCRGLSCRGY